MLKAFIVGHVLNFYVLLIPFKTVILNILELCDQLKCTVMDYLVMKYVTF
jgi:hypothetical protein